MNATLTNPFLTQHNPKVLKQSEVYLRVILFFLFFLLFFSVFSFSFSFSFFFSFFFSNTKTGV